MNDSFQLLDVHNGVVNHLRFTPDASHLFSASGDGALSATRTGSWISEGFWKSPHGGKPVTHFTIHPSGKLALSLGDDLTLRTWNLVKGRQTFTTNLKSKSKLGSVIEMVEFSPDGNNFLLSGAKAVEIWNIQNAAITREIECDAKPTSVCWLDNDNLLIGLNNGKLMWCALDKDESLTFEMYDKRVKALSYHNGFLASASSDGDITLWKIVIDDQDISELCSVNIGCRPICLTIINLADFADDYVLKLEKSTEEEEAEKQKLDEARRNAKAKTDGQVGKVIIECDDSDQEEERKQSTSKKSTPAKKINEKTNENPIEKTPPQSSKTNKRKSLNNSQSKATPITAKKAKLNKSKNNSGFIEEDL